MFKFLSFRVLLASLVLAILVESGPLAYGICQSGCNALVVACYASAGATFGTITAGASTPAVILGCNAALGVCMSGCIAAGFTPTPWTWDKEYDAAAVRNPIIMMIHAWRKRVHERILRSFENFSRAIVYNLSVP